MTQLKDLDYIYENIVGGLGKWQLKITLLLWPMSLVPSLVLFMNVFTTYTPPHRCYVDGCDTGSSVVEESWVDFALPKGKLCTVH